MNKKNIIGGVLILVATFGIIVAGSMYWNSYNENKNRIMAERLREKGQRELVVAETAAEAPTAAHNQETTAHNSDIAIPHKDDKSYTVKKAERKKEIDKKKADKKKKKKAKAKKNEEYIVDGIDYSTLFDKDAEKMSDDDRYKKTLSDDKKKAYEEKKKKDKKKKLKAGKDTVPNYYEEQSQGNVAKVDKPVVKDKNGKKVKDKFPKADINDIINSALKDENGNWIDNSDEGIHKRYAEEHGLTVEEVEKLDKEGYFNNGEGQISTGGVGDGSPEDDAGMDFD